ncbi:acetate--CoA ligase family protein [Mesorhizobium sp. CA8]|uniref:acetate--CoA ligase family protein n=1 Tax=unclassified Mesorhizobium TaxID=325217 RepID=UPI001CCEDC53|nr:MULTISPECIES: acetate--CoA ligase family protein [unclassified Mesorhizobium]MBZ9761696.1 acetate--CoA ligase family protein [Mesorhizobium sp. CA8]MBZ9820550.1 acetate--CoA ligase family protein [Mesorhizobium sp. CA4]
MEALLAPRAIALLGASPREGSLGNAMIQMARRGGYSGEIFAVNPQYSQIDGLPTFSDLQSLPYVVDHVVIGLGNERLEAALKAAVAHRASAATIFASCVSPALPGLKERLTSIATGAGMAICGGNCMGFYNHAIGLRVAGFPALQPMHDGPVGLIAQSGSVFGALAHNDDRLRLGVAISSGAEMVTTTADYLQWMVDRSSFRAVGLFIETIRNPRAFEEALTLAAEREVAVIALKVGRTARSAEMALSHTGAIAGADAIYQGMFRRYGVIQVDDLDEMAATMLMFQQPRRAIKGNLAAVHDSGGERELVVDLAERLDVAYAEPHAATLEKIASCISDDLKPANPLDAWGGSANFEAVFADSMTALLEDDNVATGAFFCNIRDGYFVSEGVANAAVAAHGRTTKPVAVVTNYAAVRHDALALRLTQLGIPVLDGTQTGLRALRHFICWRARPITAPERPPDIPEGPSIWARQLNRATSPLSEHEALELLSAYGIDTPRRRQIASLEDMRRAAASLAFPVALKTASDGVLHKSDLGGVTLDIANEPSLLAAYDRMSARLGPKALVAEMAPKGVELSLGAIIEPGWPPAVMVAAGGILIEHLGDAAFDIAPLDAKRARAMIDSLGVRRLLHGYRNFPPVELATVVETIVRFSWLVSDLAPFAAEIDVNPVIVGATGAIAVDALVVPVPHGERNE